MRIKICGSISERDIKRIVKKEIQKNQDVIYIELDRIRQNLADLDRITKRLVLYKD